MSVETTIISGKKSTKSSSKEGLFLSQDNLVKALKITGKIGKYRLIEKPFESGMQVVQETPSQSFGLMDKSFKEKIPIVFDEIVLYGDRIAFGLQVEPWDIVHGAKYITLDVSKDGNILSDRKTMRKIIKHFMEKK
jgi:hypothetical protein